jgi:serine/threonine protein kinase
MSNKLHFYTKYSKEKIKISDKPFASGGEGAIYAIASPRSYSHLVAKIYYPEKRTEEREAKMQYLMQHPPITFHKEQAPSIGWVQDLIYKDKRFIGILLIKIEGKKLTKLTLFKLPRRADKAWQRFSFKDPGALKLRLRTCFNLAVVIHQIHESGQYVLVDLKPDNVLMQANGLLAVVDMDSVEVIKDGKAIFSAPVATPEYTPPEHYSAPRTTIEEPWDHFSLGVIFYQLLLGLHPFAASCHAPYDNLVSIHDKIENDLYVHHTGKQVFFNVIPPPHQQFYKMPVEIQELFQSCFEQGASEPFLRPTPADWCNTLADLLKLPFKKIPKINIPPSNLYFSPSTLVQNLPINIPALPSDYFVLNLSAKDLTTTAPQFKKEALVQELKVAYKKYLHQHRERLLQTVLVGIVLITLCFLFPFLFIIGLVFTFIVAPQLLFTKFQDSIDSVGKSILSDSTFKLLDLDKESKLKKDRIKETNQLVHSILSKKQQELQKEKEQLNNNPKANQVELSFIQEHLQKRADLELKITDFKNWVQTVEPEILAARAEELEQYKIASADFLEQLKNATAYQSYNFRSFRNLRMKIQQEINRLKGTLALYENPLEQLRLNQQKKLEKLKYIDKAITVQTYRQGLADTAKKTLQAFKKEHRSLSQEEAYADFVQKQKILSYENHQQQQKIKHQLEQSFLKIRKDLNLNSKSELESYVELLNNPQEELQLDFASKQVRKQFDVFLQKIEALNIDSIFSTEIIKLLTQTLPKVNLEASQKTKNIKALLDLQHNMVNTWIVNKPKLEEFDQLLEELVQGPEMQQDPVEMAYWVKAGQEQVANILFNLNQYADIQEGFYGDSIISRLKNRLKTYQKEEQNGVQKIQDLEEEHLKQVQYLEQKNKDLIKNQHKLDLQKEAHEQLILEKEKVLKEFVDKETATYLESLNRREAELIEKATQEQQKELEVLQKKVNDKQVVVLTELKKVEQTLEQLNLDYATFEKSTGSIRANAELVYTSKRLVTDQKCQELTDLVGEIQKEYPEALQLIKKNVPYYQGLKVRILEYKDNLKDLNQLQEEKIRLDTLSEWKKSYNSRIYIKDLLLNKVEQLDRYEQKKK